MEWNYLLEFVVIILALKVICLNQSNLNLKKKLLNQGLTVFVFGIIHYFIICWLMNGKPIWLEAVFNAWMFLFAACLGRLFQALWLLLKNKWLRYIVTFILSVIFVAFIFGVLNSRRSKIDVRFDPRRYSYHYQESYLQTKDGCLIRMWHIKGPLPTRKLVLVTHGIGANLGDTFPFCLIFLRKGWDVITFDWRGHGLSSGHKIEFGEIERNDIQAIVDYISGNNMDYEQRVAFGVSMGGGNLIKNFDLLKTVGFSRLILDSALSDIREAIVARLSFLPVSKSLKWYLAEFVCLLVSPVLNYETVKNSPLSMAAANLENTRVLLIHGGEDNLIPVNCAIDLHRELPEALFSLYDKAGHIQAYQQESARYLSELDGFLNDEFH